MINSNLKLSEIVNQSLDNAQILNKYGLDFCCGGQRTLKAACEEKKLDENIILNELNEAKNNISPKTKFENWSAKFLMDYIYNNHHNYIRDKGPLIKNLLNKIEQVHGRKHPELKEINNLFNEIDKEINDHLIEEETTLLTEKNYSEYDENKKNNLINLIETAILDHEKEGIKIKELIKLSDNFKTPTDACTTYKLAFNELKNYIEDLLIHIHLENNILFPKIKTEIQ